MARKKNLLAAFALLAVMAIGSMGLGYAYWSDALTVNGTVNTGTLDMRWVLGANPTSDNETGAYNVASCNASGSTTKTLSVTLDEAYPGYSCTVTASIVQNGSVPGQALAPSGIAYDPTILGFSGFTCSPADDLVIGATETCSATVTVLSSVTSNGTQDQAYTFAATLNFENYHP